MLPHCERFAAINIPFFQNLSFRTVISRRGTGRCGGDTNWERAASALLRGLLDDNHESAAMAQIAAATASPANEPPWRLISSRPFTETAASVPEARRADGKLLRRHHAPVLDDCEFDTTSTKIYAKCPYSVTFQNHSSLESPSIIAQKCRFIPLFARFRRGRRVRPAVRP